MKDQRYLGQHFLKSKKIRDKIVDVIKKNCPDAEILLEIGTGEGFLTEELLKLEVPYLAVEKDKQLVQEVKERFGSIDVFEGDARDFEIETLKKPVMVVGNLPYYAAKEIIFNLLKKPSIISSAHFVVQYEFALKFLSKVNEEYYSKYSVWASNYYKVEKEFVIEREVFSPPPKVKSMLISFYPKKNPEVSEEQSLVYFKWCEKLFLKRRKYFISNFDEKRLKKIQLIFEEKGVSLKSRAEEIEPEIFEKIFEEK
jgi:16S rRNA (adenine1518-N6/adenine1519-N6)-dimethyltransferase